MVNRVCVDHKACQVKQEHLGLEVHWDLKVNLVHQGHQVQLEMALEGQ